MDIIEIKGKINTAICYARVVEDEAIEQIRRMCDYPMTEGSRIRIMPDVHSGKGCTIGTTMTITVTRSVPSGKAYNRKKEKQRIGVEFRNGFDADFLRSLVLFIHFRINERSE